MKKTKKKTPKDRLFHRVRRQRLKSITVLPSLVTIFNGICGFTAIVLAGKVQTNQNSHFSHPLAIPYFAMAGYMIILAMVADMLDGRLARMSKSTSSFGGQLDSLCDVISFGVAPAFLLLKMLEHSSFAFSQLNPAISEFLKRSFWLAAAAYLSCAAIRLARFNVENEENESAHMSFIGLPSPAAAGVIVSLIIFHQETLPQLAAGNTRIFTICENLIIYALPFVALAMAILMISRIRYAHVLNQYLRGKKPFAHLIRALVLLGLIIWSRQAAMVLIFCGFAASGFVKWSYCRFLKKDFRADVPQRIDTIKMQDSQTHTNT
ncbi:MAG: CDP-alcohol phosphatidyltransferase family protein [Sedimentisphaerales bacterium]|nr:CDP-alcohol phosphatidyltransferase family protein [Sedimentisphaerales bacterium]